MDLDDSLSLSMYELEKGITVFTRSEEWFDCYPAVQTAFKHTKGLKNYTKHAVTAKIYHKAVR